MLFLGSLAYSGYATYNLAVYDNCVGPDASPDECIFVPDEEIVDCEDPLCDEGECEEYGGGYF